MHFSASLGAIAVTNLYGAAYGVELRQVNSRTTRAASSLLESATQGELRQFFIPIVTRFAPGKVSLSAGRSHTFLRFDQCDDTGPLRGFFAPRHFQDAVDAIHSLTGTERAVGYFSRPS